MQATVHGGRKESDTTERFHFTWQLMRLSRWLSSKKNLPANSGAAGDSGSIPRSRRSLGGGYGNPFQYSCLENPMDRGAWQPTVPGFIKSQT